jgi:hypothetical protein
LICLFVESHFLFQDGLKTKTRWERNHFIIKYFLSLLMMVWDSYALNHSYTVRVILYCTVCAAAVECTYFFLHLNTPYLRLRKNFYSVNAQSHTVSPFLAVTFKGMVSWNRMTFWWFYSIAGNLLIIHWKVLNFKF